MPKKKFLPGYREFPTVTEHTVQYILELFKEPWSLKAHLTSWFNGDATLELTTYLRRMYVSIFGDLICKPPGSSSGLDSAPGVCVFSSRQGPRWNDAGYPAFGISPFIILQARHFREVNSSMESPFHGIRVSPNKYRRLPKKIGMSGGLIRRKAQLDHLYRRAWDNP